MKTLMKCGHIGYAKDKDGNPCCVICAGSTPDAFIVEDNQPNLIGRKAQYSRPSATAPSYSIATPYNGGTARVAESPKYGWICPKCGKVYAPDVKECWNCNYLANIGTSGRINQSSSAETHMENVTATMNTQEKRVREDGSLAIDKSWFPNLTKNSTVYAGGGSTKRNSRRRENEEKKRT